MLTLDYWERKKRLRHGAIVRVASRAGVTPQYVSQVLKDGKGRKDIVADLAAEMGEPVEIAFPDTVTVAA